ncbi:MAG: hypothetical protein SFX18_18655 [Pirellulales bacterium]|nr:hypothetical protein [Pirellulales bacterium]
MFQHSLSNSPSVLGEQDDHFSRQGLSTRASNGNWLAIFASFCLILAVSGCGEAPPATVTGQVLVDGKPAEGVQMMFVEDIDYTAGDPKYGACVSQAGGNFSVTYSKGEAGLPAGNYKVLFFWYVDGAGNTLPPNKKPDEVPGGRQKLLEEYTKDKTTPEKVVVDRTGGKFTFQLKSKK